MFKGKELECLKGRLEEMERNWIKRDALVECEVCGCLLYKTTAIEGQPELRQREGLYVGDLIYVHRTYYCKTHAVKQYSEEKEEGK